MALLHNINTFTQEGAEETELKYHTNDRNEKRPLPLTVGVPEVPR